MNRILVVDDDPLTRKILSRMLGPKYEVQSFENGEEAFRHLAARGADIIITDMQMPKMNGLELLTKAKEISPEVLVFVITGFSTIDSAVEAVKKGASDYIAKPFEPDDVLIRIERAVRERGLQSRVELLEQERRSVRDKYLPLTGHPRMVEVLELAKKVARTDSTVLIQGETGVGKELIARMIHQWSRRKEEAFVPVNCGALSEGVLESELFGHEKGAFTGASGKRVGFFEMADKGTLFLDEIGTTEGPFQVKLLRVLQDRTVYRVGGAAAIPVDARIVAASNQSLEKEAREGSFRSDLYYRLGVVTIEIPPLRERLEDVLLLADHFIGKYRHINPGIEGVSPAGLDLLMDYDYPGNVRELENLIERAMILEGSDRLTPSSLLIRGKERPAEKKSSDYQGLDMEGVEKAHIQRVLRKCGGKKVEAARMLGINKTTLWRKMKKYGMEEFEA